MRASSLASYWLEGELGTLEGMEQEPLVRYLECFRALHRNANKNRGAAPHKPILLLAILQELDLGRIRSNLVALTPELVAAFQTHWHALVPPDSGWQPKLTYPFRYLQRDGFWTLVKSGQPVTIATPYEPTLSQLAALCDGGRFAGDLWQLLAERHTREIFRQQLLGTYFAETGAEVAEDAASSYLSAQAEALKRQALARFRLHPTVKEQATDGYFVRSRLFPKVIKELYGFSCCVCQASARLGNSSLIDGAHILPFFEFHNDDPRNGLALCKNHHWGFDAGAWGLTDSYEIVAAPGLIHDLVYIEPGKPIALPKDQTCLPDPQALAWHREQHHLP
jgi:putative restriction endonuclease